MEIKKINYLNNEYDLDGLTLEDALRILKVDKDSVEYEISEDTVYVIAKAGCKGAISLRALAESDLPVEAVISQEQFEDIYDELIFVEEKVKVSNLLESEKRVFIPMLFAMKELLKNSTICVNNPENEETQNNEQA